MLLFFRFALALAVVAWLAFVPVQPVLASSLAGQPLNGEAASSCLVDRDPVTVQPRFRNFIQMDDCSIPVGGSVDVLTEFKLPDLLTLPPNDLKIVILPDGSHELRLSNTIWNGGVGRLELQAVNDSGGRTSSVEQYIYNGDELQYRYPVGEFIWHPTHDHFHFEEFSIYELWTLSPTGRLDKLLSTSGKLSYCVIDTDIVDRKMDEFSPYKRYGGCGQKLQGLSIGWGDTYESHLDGQSIPLRSLRDGVYALKSTVNPYALLLEASYDNNDAVVYLDIAGNKITQISVSEFVERLCQDSSAWMVTGLNCSY